jgi:hypothetical protein
VFLYGIIFIEVIILDKANINDVVFDEEDAKLIK